jgi:hypothetical protein
MNTKLFTSLSVALALVLPVACIAEPTPEEPVATDYQLLEGSRHEARCVDADYRRDAEDRISCRAVEVRRRDADGACRCDDAGRRDLDEAERVRVRDAVAREARFDGRDLDCACELRQTEREEARACEEVRGDDVRDERDARVHGWCGDVRRGVDAELDRCDDEGRRGIRLVGDARLRDDAALFIRCE